MENNENPKTREEIFAEKAQSYTVCYSATCELRDHCLRHILAGFVPADKLLVRSVNLNNPEVQRADCPLYTKDELVRMPVGLKALYFNMPKRIERSVKNHLIGTFSRKAYYEFHNGTSPLTPDIEARIRQIVKDNGWTEEPEFDGYVEDYLW